MNPGSSEAFGRQRVFSTKVREGVSSEVLKISLESVLRYAAVPSALGSFLSILVSHLEQAERRYAVVIERLNFLESNVASSDAIIVPSTDTPFDATVSSLYEIGSRGKTLPRQRNKSCEEEIDCVVTCEATRAVEMIEDARQASIRSAVASVSSAERSALREIGEATDSVTRSAEAAGRVAANSCASQLAREANLLTHHLEQRCSSMTSALSTALDTLNAAPLVETHRLQCSLALLESKVEMFHSLSDISNVPKFCEMRSPLDERCSESACGLPCICRQMQASDARVSRNERLLYAALHVLGLDSDVVLELFGSFAGSLAPDKVCGVMTNVLASGEDIIDVVRQQGRCLDYVSRLPVCMALTPLPPLGCIVADAGPPVNGVQVLEILAGEAADMAGLKQGDIITAVDGRPVCTKRDFSVALHVAPSRRSPTGIRGEMMHKSTGFEQHGGGPRLTCYRIDIALLVDVSLNLPKW